MTSLAVHIDQLFFSAPGGIGTYIRELVPALARQDPSLDIKLFHARFGADARPEPWVRDYWVEELPAGIRSLYPRWDLTARPPLPATLAATDVLHVPMPAAIPPAGQDQRLVVTVHDLAFELFPNMFLTAWRYLYKLGLRAAVKRADAIITPSRNTAEDLLSRTKVNPSKLHVVPQAPSLSQGDSDPDEALARLKITRPYLLFVGTLEPRKNLVRLVRAYRRVAATGLPHALVLAGPLGWHQQALLREIALAGPGEIVMTGALPTEDLDAVFRGAAAFAYVSLYEGFGLPIIEAMARGIPVIASNSSSMPEVSGDAALAVDPRSVRGISQAIEQVLTDDGLGERLARAGLDRAARFSWDETARLTLQVYEKAGER